MNQLQKLDDYRQSPMMTLVSMAPYLAIAAGMLYLYFSPPGSKRR